MRPNVFKTCKAKLEMSVHNAHLAKPNSISTQTLHTNYYRHSGEGAATGPAHLADILCIPPFSSQIFGRPSVRQPKQGQCNELMSKVH